MACGFKNSLPATIFHPFPRKPRILLDVPINLKDISGHPYCNGCECSPLPKPVAMTVNCVAKNQILDDKAIPLKFFCEIDCSCAAPTVGVDLDAWRNMPITELED